MSKGSKRLRRQREKKKILQRIEMSKKNYFGVTDLTPFNVGKKEIVFK